MILDACKDLGDGANVECDVCIVGSGPAGITLALELTRHGLQVIVLEAGEKRWSRASQDFFLWTGDWAISEFFASISASTTWRDIVCMGWAVPSL
jgi:choline dehydrogenase-like flavoprotein